MAAFVERRQNPTRLKIDQNRSAPVARYRLQSEAGAYRGAYLADVSSGGLRLIGRGVVAAKVGEAVELEFSLPGESRIYRQHGVVVRCPNEYVVAVKFLNPSEELKSDVQRQLGASPLRRLKNAWRELKAWGRAHRHGLQVFACGLVVGLSVASWIYIESDQYRGRTLQPWGHSITIESIADYFSFR